MTEHLPGIVTALAIGLLIGAEREWNQREQKTEIVMAGIRTFGLLGLLGGVTAAMNEFFGPFAWIAVLAAVTVLVVAGYLTESRVTQDWGMTTEVAMLLTFVLGVLASSGEPLLAAGLGVLVAALLSMKKLLHTQVHRLKRKEVSGALQLLFISVVMLPLLPNQTIGPLDIFNPYVTWWMVVLIAGLGFAAYIAIRVSGPRSGVLLTSALGGVVSSTAMTLTLSRLSHKINQPNAIAAGLLLTSGLMFPRVLIVCALLADTLIAPLILPLAVGTLIYLGATAWLAFREIQSGTSPKAPIVANLQNPFEIGSALKFTALLVAIMFAVELSRRYLGDAGVYVMSAVSGAADVDAITLSLSRLVGTELTAQIAAQGILIAALSNSLIKLGMVWLIAGKTIAMRVSPFVAMAVISLIGLMFLS